MAGISKVTGGGIADGTLSVADIADDAITADKLANSINTAIAANTAKTGITSGQASAITANTSKVTNYNQTKSDIDALGIAASSITGALPAISGASLTGLTSSQLPAGSVVQVGTVLLTAGNLSISTTTETALTSWATSFTKKFANSKLVCHLQWWGYYTSSPSYWWLRAMVNGTNVTSASGSGTHGGSGTIQTHNQGQYTFSAGAHQQWNTHFWDTQNNTTANFTFSFRQQQAGAFHVWDDAIPKLIITEIKV